MKRKMMLLFIVWSMFIFVAVNAWPQEKIWVFSDGAKLKEDRKASSATIAELPVGAELTVLKYKKRWYEVTTQEDQSGWIYRGKISKEPPEENAETSGDDSTTQLLTSLGGSSVGADETDSARSIRGLSKEAKEYAKRSGTSQQYQDALDQVLALKVTDQEIEQFLKSGKIGEYAE